MSPPRIAPPTAVAAARPSCLLVWARGDVADLADDGGHLGLLVRPSASPAGDEDLAAGEGEGVKTTESREGEPQWSEGLSASSAERGGVRCR